METIGQMIGIGLVFASGFMAGVVARHKKHKIALRVIRWD